MKNVAFILSHSDGRLGKIDVLKGYIQEKGYRTALLLHPLDNYAESSTIFIDLDGQVKNIRRRPDGIRNYWQDIKLSITFIRPLPIEVFIALDNFDTLPAIFCRKILRKKIGRIIYFPSDYSGNRFSNKLLNIMYLVVERIAIRYSDQVVSNTLRAEQKRLAMGLQKNKSVIIPNGVRMAGPKFIRKEISKGFFVYVGDVNIEHGLYDLIKTLSPWIEKLVIIGSGKDWSRTIEFAKGQKFELETHFQKDREYVLNYLQSFEGFGLAPYNHTVDWTHYCSPVKVGEYISCGVPVLMSDVPEIAEDVERRGYGVAYHRLHAESLIKRIESFNTHDYHLKAEEFYKLNNANHFFTRLGV